MKDLLVSIALALSVATGCSARDQTKPQPEAARPLAVVHNFDCVSSLLEKKGETLRGMHLGGPGGAAWNWDAGDLVCSIEIALGCRAKTDVRVLVGDSEHVATAGVGTPDRMIATVSIPPASWVAAIKHGAEAYSKLRLIARAAGVCEAGPRAGQSFSARDELVARVASGE